MVDNFNSSFKSKSINQYYEFSDKLLKQKEKLERYKDPIHLISKQTCGCCL